VSTHEIKQKKMKIKIKAIIWPMYTVSNHSLVGGAVCCSVQAWRPHAERARAAEVEMHIISSSVSVASSKL